MKKKKIIASLKITFLHYLAETRGNVLRSCELSGLARNTALRHREKDANFREKWDSVLSGKSSTTEEIKNTERTPNTEENPSVKNCDETVMKTNFAAIAENGTNDISGQSGHSLKEETQPNPAPVTMPVRYPSPDQNRTPVRPRPVMTLRPSEESEIALKLFEIDEPKEPEWWE